MQVRFIVAHNNQEQGPFTETEVLELLKAGDLLPIDYYYDEELKDWVMIQDRFNPNASEIPLATPLAAPPDILNSMTAYPAALNVPPPETTITRKREVPVVLDEIPPDLELLPAPIPPAPPAPKVPPQPRPVVAIAPVAPAAAPVAPIKAPPPAKPAAETPTRVQFHGGVGMVSLKQLHAGRVLIRLTDPHNTALQAPQETVIEIEAGPAKSITWTVPESVTAGEETVVEMVTRDAYDNISPLYEDALELTIKGEKTVRLPAKFSHGRCRVAFTWTVAEMLNLEVTQSDRSNLALPATRELHVAPGLAHQIVIEATDKAVAGDNVPVTVKAVDRFGNIATDYNGDLGLEVVNQKSGKAS